MRDLTPLIFVVAFVAVVLIVQSVAGLFFSAGDRQRRLNRRLSMLESGMKPDEVYAALVRTKAKSPDLGSASLVNLHDQLLEYTHQAGLGVTPFRLLALWLGSAAALWAVSLALLQWGKGANLFANGAVSLFGAGALSLLAIWVWVSGQRRARLRAIEEQLPLALDIVNRAIKAGHPVISAVQLAANELGDPIGSEFGLIVDETTYGMDFKDSLVNFAKRTGSPDAHYFAVSVGIQSQTGGNLGEILEGLASVIRARTNLVKKVKALASEGRMSAYILSALPAIVIGFFALFAPTFYTAKFADPIFWPVVGLVMLLYLAGWLIIQRIINFKY